MARTSIFCRRPAAWSLFFFVLLCGGLPTIEVSAQTTDTYYLHRESSTTANLFQLKAAAPDSADLVLQTIELRSQPAGEYLIKGFDTPANVPNTPGVMPAGSTITIPLWMRKTAAAGRIFARAKLYLNGPTGTPLCTATGAGELSTGTIRSNYSCTLASTVTMTASDRLYLWVGVSVTESAGSSRVKAELLIEGTYDSHLVVPRAFPPASISGVSPTSGVVGTAVTVSGSNFGATQGASKVTFNGVESAATSWSDTSITTSVPFGATTGPLAVTVKGVASNSPTFTVVTGGVAGTVTRASDGAGVSGATVEALRSGLSLASVTTGGGGAYSLGGLTPGTYDVRVTAAGYAAELTAGVVVNANATTAANFSLRRPGAVTGRVTKADGVTPLAGATVKLYQGAARLGVMPADGSGGYTFAGLKPGTYRVQASASGHQTSSQDGVTLAESATVTVNFSLNAGGAGGVSYIYDELGRLAGVINLAGESAAYSYDAVGNLTSISRATSAQVSVIEFTPNGGAAGAAVRIYGTGFSATAGENAVAFNGVAAVVTSATATELVTSVPAGAATGPITVTTPAGSAASAAPFVVEPSRAPVVDGFTPSIGTAGTAVGISGSNFDPSAASDRVKFNLAGVAANTATATSIGTTVPAAATSGRVSVTTPFGTGVSAADFFVPPTPYGAADVEVTGRMAVGESRAVSLAASGKIALILFEGAAGQQVSLHVGGVTFTSADVSIQKPDGSSLASASGVGASGRFLDTMTLPAAGTYTIVVDPQSTYTGALTLNLYNVADVTAAITPGGPAVSVTTTTPGQNARLTFSGAFGQHVSLNLSGNSIPGTTNVSVRKPDGTSLVSTNLSSAGSYVDIPYLPDAGTYTILVDPQNANVGGITLLLNDATDAAAEITPGGPAVTVTTGTPGQNARLTFAGAAGQRVSLRMTGVTIGSGCCSTYVSVVRPDGTSLVSPTFVSTDGGFFDTMTLGAAGTYTILVDPQGTATGSMTLTLYDVPTDVTATITPGGPAVTVTTTVSGQNARLTFAGTAGQRVSLRMTGVTIGNSVCCSARVSFVNPDGTTLVSPTFVGTSGGFIDTVTLPASGNYTVVVDPQDFATGSITLTLYDVPADVAATITPGGPAVSVTTTTPGQNARLTFSGTSGQRVSLSMTGVTIGTSSCCSARVSITKPDGTTLVSPTFVGTAGGFFDTLSLPATGTYTILVDPQDFAAGGITLRLHDVPADTTGTITPGGAAVTATTTTPGQNARLTFSGSANQRVSLRMTGVTIGTSSCCSTRVSITKPDGTTLVSPTFVGTSGGFIDTLTLPAAGTYTILVDPQDGATGNITLTLYNVPADASATVTVNGPAANITTSTPGQNGVVTFAGTSGQQVTVRATGGTMGCVTLTLRRPDGTSMTSSLNCAASFNLSTQTLNATGTYSVTVDPNSTNTGSISVSVTNP